jgi:hypothetical protein
MKAVPHHIRIEDSWMQRFVEKFGLIKSELLVILVGWIPMAIFAYAWGDEFLDIGTHIKFLISVPLFVITYPVLLKKLNWTLNHIQKTKIVCETDLDKLDELIYTQDRITNSLKIKFTILFLAFLTEISVYFFIKTTHLSWRSLDRPAGWWFHFISQPLFYYVFYSFILRGAQWWQFLFKLSRLDLRIQAANGDQAGGLAFLSTVLNAFIFPAFAFSTTVASGAATLIIERKMTLAGLQTTFISYCSFIVIALITPLFFFVPVLLKAREKCIHKYGVLVSSQLSDFDKKWLNKKEKPEDKLEVPDFSAVTDYGSEVNRVHSMKLHPLKLVDMLLLSLFVALPFLPVYSLEMPWKEIFKRLFDVVY